MEPNITLAENVMLEMLAFLQSQSTFDYAFNVC
jgi:hypothetical protein